MSDKEDVELQDAEPIACSSPASAEAEDLNATKAAAAALARRRERLKPMKFAVGDQPNVITNDLEQSHPMLRLFETFAVADDDAAQLLSQSLGGLTDHKAVKGDLGCSNGAMALLHELEPRDPAEAMLCSQMVGAHLQVMRCLRLGGYPDRPEKLREGDLRHAERLMRIFAQQLDALNKHRGKGQQKVTVEHVTVNEGGQAVVGAVESR
jgi:hypothetical protein